MTASLKSSNDLPQSSVAKALELLVALGELGVSDDVTIRELVDKTGTSRPTVHRLLAELKKSGFVESVESTGRYRLGTRILILSAQSLGGRDIRRMAQPMLRGLVEESGFTAHLSIRDELSIVYIDKVEAMRGVRIATGIGERRSVATTAMGKIFLAYGSTELTEAVIDEGIVQCGPKSLTSPEKLKDNLRLVLKNGYAVDDEESNAGVRCVAAPIRDHSGEVVAAMSVSALTSQISLKATRSIGAQVRYTADQISRQLGYHGQCPSFAG